MQLKRVLFFLRTIFLSPAVNHTMPIMGAALAVMLVGRELTGGDVLLVMYIASLGIVAVRSAFVDDKGNRRPCFALLPLSRAHLHRAIFMACLIYSVFVQTLLTAVLFPATALPRIGDPHITFRKEPSGEVISVYRGYVMDVDCRIEVPYREAISPSLLFGIVTRPRRPVFHGWFLILPLLFAGATLYFTFSRLAGVSRRWNARRMLHVAVCAFYAIPAALVLADHLLPSYAIWKTRTALDSRPWVIPALCALPAVVFIAANLLLYRSTTTLPEEA